MLTLKELETEITVSKDYKDLVQAAWEAKIEYRGIQQRSVKDFDYFEEMYVKKINALRGKLAGEWDFNVKVSEDGKVLKSDADILDAVKAKMDDWYYANAKEQRLLDKLACVIKERQLREDGLVTREGIHDAANYYVDYDNGTDGGGGTVHDGLAEPADPGGAVYTMVDGTTTATDGTHAVLALGAFDNDADDNYNGDYLYNITRSAGVIITDYDADDGDDGSVLTHANIAGQVATDTFYILRATKNIHYMTATLARTAGDVVYLRANTTWDQGTEAVDITFDEDGTTDLYISIIGCDSVTNDPWSDGSDVKPIVDFEDAAYEINVNTDDFWWLERLDIIRSGDFSGAVYVNASYSAYFKDCDISDTAAASMEGMQIISSSVNLDGCTFEDCNAQSININQSTVTIEDCTIDAGSINGSTHAIQATNVSVVFVIDTSIAPTNAFSTFEISCSAMSVIYMRNVTFGVSEDIQILTAAAVHSEDHDGTFESHKQELFYGTIVRATASARAGGADSYAVMTPNVSCGVNNPLTLGNPMNGFSRVWVTKDVEINIAVYCRVGTAWDGALTAAQCYAQFSWLSNAATAARTLTQSTEIINNVADWTTGVTALTSGAFTPLQTGWVYIWFNVAHWEDVTEEVWVDIKPVIS